jgi:hypothetical protein
MTCNCVLVSLPRTNLAAEGNGVELSGGSAPVSTILGVGSLTGVQ